MPVESIISDLVSLLCDKNPILILLFFLPAEGEQWKFVSIALCNAQPESIVNELDEVLGDIELSKNKSGEKTKIISSKYLPVAAGGESRAVFWGKKFRDSHWNFLTLTPEN